jgi:hypothetical protein
MVVIGDAWRLAPAGRRAGLCRTDRSRRSGSIRKIDLH